MWEMQLFGFFTKNGTNRCQQLDRPCLNAERFSAIWQVPTEDVTGAF
ncbi:hypothetical protein [Kamptonema formosum]|nr:hypothetical protein [Oscillatoria sp. PCC 10802]